MNRFRTHPPAPAFAAARPAPPAAEPPRQFRSLAASELYCPRCREATPVRERLLLVLPQGNLYEYRCAHCGTSTGTRTDEERDAGGIVLGR
jgi:hypothetical protein